MKYLLVLLVMAIAIGIWRSRHRKAVKESRPSAAQARIAPPQEMVECAQCGLHLPRADAVSNSARQIFCGTAHRDQYLSQQRQK